MSNALPGTAVFKPGAADLKSSLVELKNGKLIFKQKPLSLEKLSETLQEIVNFREMLETRVANQEPALDTIPEEYFPVIAKLAHESDKSILALAKHIRLSLLPIQDEDVDQSAAIPLILPVHAVENTLKTIISRVNYGLDSPPRGTKVPASLCVWRWEVKEKHRDWLPKHMLEKIELRTRERSRAKEDLAAIFKALPAEEQSLLIDPKGLEKQLPKQNKLPGDAPLNSTDLIDGTPKSLQKTEEGSVEAPEKLQGRSRKNDPEKLLKEKEKLEKKAAKVEKEKKEKDAQSKSQSIMANFFTKPKLARKPSSNAEQAPVAGPSKVQSDFEKTFKPFVLKKDTEIAPLNRFVDKTRGKSKRAVTHLNEDVEMSDVTLENGDLGQLDTTERLKQTLRSLPKPPLRPGIRSTDPEIQIYKSFNKYSVRQLVAQLSEAEIAGDDALVRKLLGKLSSRSLIPAKVLIFKDDTRPGYFGTWTRNSRVIGPRTPLARDALMFDYSYDSGEEWEEEVQEADDVADEGEDDDGDDEEADSDLESWLVDDDDVEEVETPLEDREDSPLPPEFTPPPPPVPKRKPDNEEQKIGKKRKVVVHLVPFVKGPCYEPQIGTVDESFNPYRIQLFNDTPFPIDPFSFVSKPVENRQAAKDASDGGVFAVPSLPDRLNNSANGIQSSPVIVPAKRANPTPKFPFPETHLPFLLSKIGSLATGSISFLVETVYQDLKEHKVKKNAIEAKVRDVAEKSKDKKIWVVRPEMQAVVV